MQSLYESPEFLALSPDEKKTVQDHYANQAPVTSESDTGASLFDTPEYKNLSFDDRNKIRGHYGVELEERPSRSIMDVAKDVSIPLMQSVIDTGSLAVQAFDMITPGDLRGFMKNKLGYDPKASNEVLQGALSEAQKVANERVEGADGFMNIAAEYVKNPSTIGNAIARSSMPMMAGGAAGKLIGAAAPSIGRLAVGGGEGVISGISSAEGMQDELGRSLSVKEKAMAAGSGLAVGAIGGLGAVLSKALKVTDIDSYLAGKGLSAVKGKIFANMAKGGVIESLEEMPQSAVETMVVNAATDKPLMRGVERAMASGGIVGAAMGGATNITAKQQAEQTAKDIENTRDADGFLSLDNLQKAEGVRKKAGIDSATIESEAELEAQAKFDEEKRIESDPVLSLDKRVEELKQRINEYKANDPRRASAFEAGMIDLVNLTGEERSLMHEKSVVDREAKKLYGDIGKDTGEENVKNEPDIVVEKKPIKTDQGRSATEQVTNISDIRRIARIKAEGKQLGKNLGLKSLDDRAQAEKEVVEPESQVDTKQHQQAVVTPEKATSPQVDEMTEAINQGGINLESAKTIFSHTTIAQLTKKRPGLFKVNGGENIDEMAQSLGYETANDMQDSWSYAKTKKDQQAILTDEAKRQFDIAEDQAQAANKTENELFTDYRGRIAKNPESVTLDEINSLDLPDGKKVRLVNLKSVPSVKKTVKSTIKTEESTVDDYGYKKLSPGENQKVQNKFRVSVGKVLKKSRDVDNVMSILDARAGSLGMTTGEYINMRGISLVADSKAFGEEVRQSHKAAVEIISDAKAIIHAFKSADVSSIHHELFHIFRKDLKGSDLKVAEKFAGAKDGKWTVAAEEKITRAYERYLREGKAPTKSLEKVFNQIKEAMKRVYQVVRGSDIDVEMTPEVKALFDKMLTPGKSDQFVRDDDGGVLFQSVENTNTTNVKASKDGVTANIRPLDGIKSIEDIIAKLKKVSTTKADKERYSEETTAKMVDSFNKLKAAATSTRTSIASKQKMLASFLRLLPAPVAKKISTPLSFISRYKGTPAHERRLNEALAKAETHLTSHLRRRLRSDIEKGLKPKALAKNRIRKGNIGYEADRDLAAIRVALNDNTYESKIPEIDRLISNKENEISEITDNKKLAIAEDELADLISTKNSLEIFGDIKSRSLDELVDARDSLNSIINDGRAKWRDIQDKWKEVIADRTLKVQQDITGSDTPMVESAAQATKRKAEIKTAKGQVKKFFDWTENSILSWEFVLDKVASNSGKGTLKSETVEYMGSQAAGATRAENVYNAETTEQLQEKAMELFSAKDGKELNKKFRKLSEKETGKVHSFDENGKEVDDFLISPMEAAYWYAIKKNSDSLATFEKMGVTEDTFTEIENFMGEDLVAWTDYLVDEMLQDFHQPVNEIYRSINGVNLNKTPGYITWKREVAGQIDDAGFASSSGESGISGMSKGAHKLRVANTNPFKIMSINDVVMQHTADMNNYRAWAVPSKLINGVFNNGKTQKLIEQHHSMDTLGAIKSFQSDFAKSPEELRGDMPWLDRLRGNMTTAFTGLNPTIFLKQQTSIPAMMESIPASQWLKYSGSFWSNPKKAWDTLMDSTEFQARRNKGMERDMRTAQTLSGSEAIAGTRDFMQNLAQKSMFMVKAGDSMAVAIGGYPVYKYHYNKNKSKGHAVAHELALREFEKAMDRTQQASGIKDQGRVQRGGSYMKLFTMFMTTPKQYTSNMTAAIRGYKNDPVDSAKRLALFGVVMPALFQMTASGALGLIGGDDDDKKELGKDLLASISMSFMNGIPVIRDLQKGLYNSAMGNYYGRDIQYSPMMEIGKTLTSIVSDGVKALDSDRDKTKRMDSAYGAINSLADTIGYQYGIPVQPARRWLWDSLLNDIPQGKTDAPLRRAIGYSRSAMGDNTDRYSRLKKKIKESVKNPTKENRKYRALDPRMKAAEKQIRKLKKSMKGAALERRVERIKNQLLDNVKLNT